jgi:hypothetical protein
VLNLRHNRRPAPAKRVPNMGHPGIRGEPSSDQNHERKSLRIYDITQSNHCPQTSGMPTLKPLFLTQNKQSFGEISQQRSVIRISGEQKMGELGKGSHFMSFVANGGNSLRTSIHIYKGFRMGITLSDDLRYTLLRYSTINQAV